MKPKQSSPTPKPRVRDARATRERILSMAYKEFAVRGYDGARIDAIVARCKISKNLLYHYFAGKEALYIEVMERAYRAMRDRQNELALSGEDPVADMRALVVQTIQHFIEQPDFIQLLSTENLYKAKHVRKSKRIAEMFNPLKAALDNILEKGKRQKVFRQDVDWIDLYVLISGMGAYSVSNRYTLSYVLGNDIGTPDRNASRLQHIPDMVLGYLCDQGSPNAS